LRAHEHLGPVGNLGRKRQSNVQFGTSLKILVENEVKTARGNVPGLSFLSVRYALSRDPNNYGYTGSDKS